ncbi:unnamed protein product [Amoebophrya sp. A120]|nr:unnamed protein product [Amoebophrya sp. A120]|eukprot:GSA120T00002536001.1
MGGGRQQNGRSRKQRKENRQRRKRGETASEAELRALSAYLGDRGLQMIGQAEDGNCLFRSFAQHVFRNAAVFHGDCRNFCCDTLLAHEEEYRWFLDEETDGSYAHYVANMREEGVWAGQLEILALCRYFAVDVLIFQRSTAGETAATPRKNAPGGSTAGSISDEYSFTFYEIECPTHHVETPHEGQTPGGSTPKEVFVENDEAAVRSEQEDSDLHIVSFEELGGNVESAASGEEDATSQIRGVTTEEGQTKEAVKVGDARPLATEKKETLHQAAKKRAAAASRAAELRTKREQSLASSRKKSAGTCVLLAYIGGEHYNLVVPAPGPGGGQSGSGAQLNLSQVRKLLSAGGGISLSNGATGGGVAQQQNVEAENPHLGAFQDFHTQLQDCLPENPQKVVTLANEAELWRIFKDKNYNVDDAIEAALVDFLAQTS